MTAIVAVEMASFVASRIDTPVSAAAPSATS
jgi:hypothetical protein